MKINYPAVLVAALAHFVVGGLWYGLIFTNKFIELIALSPEKLRQMETQNPTKEYLAAFATSLVLVYVLAHFVQYTKAKSALAGVQTAFWLWLGFIVTTQLRREKARFISPEYRLSVLCLCNCRDDPRGLEN